MSEFNFKKGDSVLLRTPKFRMSYPHFAEPKPFMEKGKEKGEPKFGVEMILDGETGLIGWEYKNRETSAWEAVEDIRVLMVAVAKAEWGADFNVREAVLHGGLHWPLKDGNAKADEADAKKKGYGDVYRGKQILRTQSGEKYPPIISVIEAEGYHDLDRDKPDDMRIAKRLFVGGNFAKATLNLKAGDVQKKYLTFYINGVLFIEKGEPIGGMTTEDRFGGIEGGEADYDPTAGLDDDIPF